QRLQESKTFVPHFYVTQEINASPLVTLRDQLLTQGLKVSFNDMVLRASALALRSHPAINSGYNSADDTLIRFKTIDLSVAVSMDDGLITPIVRHADFKSLGAISLEVKELVARARGGKLMPHEYSGGSFTVSNLGMHGITELAGVINPPQAAILAVGGIRQAPVLQGNAVVAGHLMNLTVSADHRVADGAVVAAFLKDLRQLLENPSLLLL
ncbi:MAG: 2-oxo acid dehydrogenase subunit E2, partial [Verrucomicrobia bacterium]|nr:2-oxo acid dehydrogenase subunit E2 [Verrucomicrobiota bacterium]